MARFVSREVVVVPFPFTDLSSAKVRPALVLTSLSRGDLILCQITSQSAGHTEAIPIMAANFESGSLSLASYVLPHRLVTANEDCVRRSVGRVNLATLQEIRERVCATIRQS
jgi:mRNA interferase MazF